MCSLNLRARGTFPIIVSFVRLKFRTVIRHTPLYVPLRPRDLHCCKPKNNGPSDVWSVYASRFLRVPLTVVRMRFVYGIIFIVWIDSTPPPRTRTRLK